MYLYEKDEHCWGTPHIYLSEVVTVAYWMCPNGEGETIFGQQSHTSSFLTIKKNRIINI